MPLQALLTGAPSKSRGGPSIGRKRSLIKNLYKRKVYIDPRSDLDSKIVRIRRSVQDLQSIQDQDKVVPKIVRPSNSAAAAEFQKEQEGYIVLVLKQKRVQYQQ